MRVLGVIPARYASTRFPGKPLVNIQGISMIQRVYQQVLKAKSIARVIVATDDARIVDHVLSFGGDVMMTSGKHQSGTDRCAEVADRLAELTDAEKFDCVVNIQGDEPFIDPQQIDSVVEVLKNEQFSIATLVKRIDTEGVLDNPNIVKAVFSNTAKALYFSRSPIPYFRNVPFEDWHSNEAFYKHIGIYAYKTLVLKELAMLPPSRLESLESLEQLRWLENGYSIGVAETHLETIGIDTPDDLLKMNFEK